MVMQRAKWSYYFSPRRNEREPNANLRTTKYTTTESGNYVGDLNQTVVGGWVDWMAGGCYDIYIYNIVLFD